MTRRTYGEALNEAMRQAMELNHRVFVFGLGVEAKEGAFGTTSGLLDQFGSERVFEGPVAEQGLTALAVGAANGGLRPVLVHLRMDFAIYAMDQVVNWAALWRFMSGGVAKMPLTIRMIVGKGWGQGPQHSKSLHAWFAHVPGLQVVVPGSPADAKGLLLSSIMSDDPTVFIESRSLYSMQEDVPNDPYFIRLGKALVRRAGTDLTLVSFGAMIPMALEAADVLAGQGISVEVVDLRCLMPLDVETIVASVRRTRHLVVAEPGWLRFGAAAEVIASVAELAGDVLLSRPKRVTWPHGYPGMSPVLETAFYPTAEHVVAACKSALGKF